jgi:cyclic pyranopterin phosphate synthase
VNEGSLTHLDADGSARMVDVGSKPTSTRRARARARVRMSPEAAAAEQTPQLIPLAHPLALNVVSVDASVDVDAGLVELVADVAVDAKTGVEMEAMVACAVAALTVYDMVKGLERGVTIEQVTLLEKTGGRNDWRLDEDG